MQHKDRSQAKPTVNSENRLKRRELLKTIGAGAVAATVDTVFRRAQTSARLHFGASEPSVPERWETQAVTRRAVAFNLADVRLLEGPLRRAQERDERYLLQLEPDRLLHNFRVNAGLKPKAPVYGGWESAEPWVSIRCHGHTLGHYLSACAMMFAATGDQRFKQRTDYILTEQRDCQEASTSGLVCTFPDGAAPLNDILDATRFVGVPWYTMHKIFAGLRDAYIYTDNGIALDVLVKLSDWAIA